MFQYFSFPTFVRIIHMAHITLSIPDGMYRKMKEHAEIKWSEVARKAIMEYMREIKGRSSSRELRSALPPETMRALNSVSVK